MVSTRTQQSPEGQAAPTWSFAGRVRAVRAARFHVLLPAALTLALAFRAGGFFADASAKVAIVLLILLVGRVMLAERPFTGWGAGVAVAAAALTLLAVWTLLSVAWSHAPFRALSEFDRTLAYLLILLLASCFGCAAADLDRALRWLALAIALIAAAALATRLFPQAFPSQTGKDPTRLAFPLTYWNALALLCALGITLLLHCSAAHTARTVTRLAAAGALPVVATTLYFTFSRGGVAAAAIGLVAYGGLARTRQLPLAVLWAGLPAAVAVRVAYGADELATDDFAQATAQAHSVALAVVLCALAAIALRAAALPADAWIERIGPSRSARISGWPVAAAVTAALVAAGVLVDVPQRAADQWRAFLKTGPVGETGDVRDRFGNAGSNGRVAQWRVARASLARDPLTGSGAGTFRLEWQRERDTDLVVNDGHSLYFETAGELGGPGLLLILVSLLAPLAVAVRRLSGGERQAVAAFIAAGLTLLVHAGVDWDWEMPALFAWYFATAGLVLASESAASGWAPARQARVVIGLGCLLVAIVPFSVARSQDALDRATRAFATGDCTAATEGALESLEALRARPEPFELLGYCDIRGGARSLAVDVMQAARDRDPEAWEYAYGLAVALALDGRDPRAQAAAAASLNPRDERALALTRKLRRGGPSRWARTAANAPIPSD